MIALVANKIDLAEKRKVTSEQAKALADRFNLIYFETSARNGENVREMLERLLSKIVSIIELSSESNNFNNQRLITTSTINLKIASSPPTKRKCNC